MGRRLRRGARARDRGRLPAVPARWEGVAGRRRLCPAPRREVKEELGLDARPVGPLVVDWVPPHDPWDDLLAFDFDGGVLAPAQIAAIRLLEGEVARVRWCSEEEATALLRPRLSKRVRVALEALRAGCARYLEDGMPAA